MAESAVTPIYAMLRTETRAFVHGRCPQPSVAFQKWGISSCVVLVWGQVSLCNPADLEFTIHLSQSLNCEDLQVRATAFIWAFFLN